MPFDGSGNFTRVHDFTDDQANGIKILSSRMDAEFDGFATGMNAVFFRNGLVPMSGDLAMGLNRLTSLGDGSAASPSIKFGSDANTGLYLQAFNQPSLSVAGTRRLTANVTGVDVNGVLTVSGAVTLSSTLAVTTSVTVGGVALITAASPALTGTPTAPTAAVNTNTTQLATTAFVNAEIANDVPILITANNASYAALAGATFVGTVNVPDVVYGAGWNGSTAVPTRNAVYDEMELKAALAGATFVGAVNVPDVVYGAGWNGSLAVPTRNAVYDQVELKANITSPTFLGVPAVPTAAASTNTTQAASTAFVMTEAATATANARAPNVQSVASAATVTPTFSNDMVKVTALAVACQFLNPTGTAAEGWGMVLRVKDNGTARALTWDTQYRAMGAALPTTTVVNKTMYIPIVYNATDTKWDVGAAWQEA